jgi:putative sterol carrier protein
MKIIRHPVEKFEDEDYKHHAAHWVDEVVDNSDMSREEKLSGYKDNGYYFVDESESLVYGVFESFDKAVEERDKYFKQL